MAIDLVPPADLDRLPADPDTIVVTKAIAADAFRYLLGWTQEAADVMAEHFFDACEHVAP